MPAEMERGRLGRGADPQAGQGRQNGHAANHFGDSRNPVAAARASSRARLHLRCPARLRRPQEGRALPAKLQRREEPLALLTQARRRDRLPLPRLPARLRHQTAAHQRQPQAGAEGAQSCQPQDHVEVCACARLRGRRRHGAPRRVPEKVPDEAKNRKLVRWDRWKRNTHTNRMDRALRLRQPKELARAVIALEGGLAMPSFADQAASRRKFLQFLAASPLWAAGAVDAFAGEALAPGSKLPDPLMWAPMRADDLIKSPKEAINVFDFEPVCRKNVPPAHFGYMASGIDDEVTLRANREGFLKFQLRPRRLVDVSKVDMSTEILGVKYA